MSLLISNQIISAVCDELESAKESAQIITAYCKLDTLIEMETSTVKRDATPLVLA